MGRVRKIDSETGSGSVPISAMLLHTFYIHHIIHTESGSGFFPKNSNPAPDPKIVTGLRIRSGSVPISGKYQYDIPVIHLCFC